MCKDVQKNTVTMHEKDEMKDLSRERKLIKIFR